MTSRPPPPVVTPFVRDGVRYAPGSSGSRDGGDRTAWLVAIDAASGEPLWRVPMWTVRDDPDAPPDPGRYFGSIGPGPEANELLVRDEYGASFVVDVATRSVRERPRAVPHDADKRLSLPLPPAPDA